MNMVQMLRISREEILLTTKPSEPKRVEIALEKIKSTLVGVMDSNPT